MEEKLLEAVKAFSLLDGVNSVTVALSGGADSMALLCALSNTKDELGIKLSAAHFNHKIRGAEADRDELFVKEQCIKMNIPLFVGSGNVPKFAEENHLSVELAARQMRYEFLGSVCDGVIATAHTASDNLETMLFNIVRGTSSKGICGIPPKRDNIIRPLILCTREEIENYCEENKIPFVTDSSNLCDEYSRNKLRLKAVPILKELNSAAEHNAIRAARSLCEDNDFLDGIAKREYEERFKNEQLNVEGFDNLHIAIQKRIIKLFLLKIGAKDLDNIHLLSVLKIALNGGKTQISGTLDLICKDGFLYKFNEEIPEFSVEILKEDFTLIEKNQKVHNLLLKNAIDCDKIVGDPVLRNRISGDEIRLKGRNCTKTLKKLFTERKIPLCEREVLPVLADDLGVVWVYNMGVAERVAVDERTKSILKINAMRK